MSEIALYRVWMVTDKTVTICVAASNFTVAKQNVSELWNVDKSCLCSALVSLDIETVVYYPTKGKQQ